MDIMKEVMTYWKAGDSAVLYCGSELCVMQRAVERAAAALTQEKGKKVHVACHDRLVGFHTPTDALTANVQDSPYCVPLRAIGDIFEPTGGDSSLTKAVGCSIADDIIVVARCWEFDFAPCGNGAAPNPDLVVAIRNVIQGNAGSTIYGESAGSEKVLRGRRMLVLLSAAAKVPETLPELKATLVELPGKAELVPLVSGVLERAKYSGNMEEAVSMLTNSLLGLSYDSADRVLAFARVEHKGVVLPAMLNTIERLKARYIADVPGLQYVSKDTIADLTPQPGYDNLLTYVREFSGVSEEWAAAHKIRPLKGLVLVGLPGTGKTMAAMQLAKELNRMLVVWNIGESQSKWVGESEATVRRVLSMVNAMEAVVLLDDFDKAGANTIKGGQGSESGVFGRLIQTLLTELSSPQSKAVFVFTANRLSSIPPELIRPERVDERFYVQLPDAATRENIIKYHVQRHNFPLTLQDKLLGLLSEDECTGNWTGAELAGLVNRAARRAGVAKADTLDLTWMLNQAKLVTPMAKQPVNASDFRQMEVEAELFVKLGRQSQPVVKKERVREVRHD